MTNRFEIVTYPNGIDFKENAIFTEILIGGFFRQKDKIMFIHIPITTAGYDVIFPSSIGTTGNEYVLSVTVYNETGDKGKIITNRTKDGFHIVPDEDGYMDVVVNY